MNSIKKITCMINILILSILISSSFSFNIKRLIRNSIVIVPSIILINVNDFANGIDLNNGMTSFKASCASCHNGGGNSVPFSQGKTLSLTDLKNNGYNDVDKMIPLITKGKGLMPGFGSFVGSKGQIIPARFTDEEMKNIASYVLEKSKNNWQ